MLRRLIQYFFSPGRRHSFRLWYWRGHLGALLCLWPLRPRLRVDVVNILNSVWTVQAFGTHHLSLRPRDRFSRHFYYMFGFLAILGHGLKFSAYNVWSFPGILAVKSIKSCEGLFISHGNWRQMPLRLDDFVRMLRNRKIVPPIVPCSIVTESLKLFQLFF